MYSKNKELAKFLFKIDPFEYYRKFHWSVFNDKKVLSTALNRDADIFKIPYFSGPITNLLINNFEENKSLANILLKSYVKKRIDISGVETFIKQISWTNSQISEQLKKMYEKHLKTAYKLHSKDIKNQALLLSTSKNKNLYKLFTDKKIISEFWEINLKEAKKWSKDISEWIENSSLKGNKESIIQFLLSKIWLQDNDLKVPEIWSLIEGIFNVLQIQKSSVDANIEIEDNNKEWEDTNRESGELNSWVEKDDIEKFDYCLNNENCSFSYSLLDWDKYIIDTWFNNITISKQDYKEFSPYSLENFIKLNALMYQCGLSFILEDKYKKWFFQLMKNRHIGFTPQWGQWFTDFFQLDALNVIANLVWIPKNLYWKDSSVWKFSDKETAKQAFQSIYSTWKINDESISTAWGLLINQSAIKETLLDMEVLKTNGGLDSVKAEWILKDGGYTKEQESEKSVKKLDFQKTMI